jgi:hypothetical protein
VQACVHLGNGIALFGDGDGHVFRSTDYGASWSDLGATAGHIYAFLYLGNGIVILGDNTKHVFRSVNYGLSWSDLGAIASHTIVAATYLGCGITLISDLNGHVIRSTPCVRCFALQSAPIRPPATIRLPGRDHRQRHLISRARERCHADE